MVKGSDKEYLAELVRQVVTLEEMIEVFVVVKVPLVKMINVLILVLAMANLAVIE